MVQRVENGPRNGTDSSSSTGSPSVGYQRQRCYSATLFVDSLTYSDQNYNNFSSSYSFPSTKVRLYSEQEEMAAAIGKCWTLAISLQPNLYVHHLHRRYFLNNGPDTVEELLDRHVVKKEKSYDDVEDEKLTRQRLTSTRREVLGLYRDIIRATRFFMWPDSHGVLWRDVLRANARKEFEEARFEKDPEIITRLLIGGHDAVQAALDKLVEKQRQQIAKEQEDHDRR